MQKVKFVSRHIKLRPFLKKNTTKENRREREKESLPSPQPSLTLLKGVLSRKKSSKVVEGSTEFTLNLSPFTANSKSFPSIFMDVRKQ